MYSPKVFLLMLRLNLTPTPREKRTRSRTQTVESVSKKPRLDTSVTQKSSVSSSASGCIQIIDVDSAGRYIQIKNESDSVSYDYVCLLAFLVCLNAELRS